MIFFLELKEIGLSNKTVARLEYLYRKLERKISEILNFKKKNLFVVSLRKGLLIFPTSLGRDAGTYTSIPERACR